MNYDTIKKKEIQMLGAIIGDLAGSIYEFDQFKKIKPIRVKNIIENHTYNSNKELIELSVTADNIISNILDCLFFFWNKIKYINWTTITVDWHCQHFYYYKKL